VSKKKGMLSWLGFGQKERKVSAEESNNDNTLVTEHEKLSDIESVEQLKASVIEQVTEPVEEQSITSLVVNEISSTQDENINDKIVVTEESTSAELTPDVMHEALLDKSLLANSETIEQADEVVLEYLSAPESPVGINLEADVVDVSTEGKLGFFARLKQSLSKTRHNLGGGLVDLFRGKQIDDDLFEELETHLLMADVGVETTMKIIESLTQSANRKQLKDASALYDLLKVELKKIIENANQPLVIPESDGPFVMLMVGVNGVGKTTTIGKLAKQFQAEGKSVILAAGDTFRAAAVEQLQVWGERNGIPVIAQHTGADSASVIFDAISAAKARKVDVIIADTAGRLQNKAHLMEELKKVVRVMKKLDVNAPHEVMLTLDAGTGQNALSQTKLFDEAVGLTGLTLTKLDGTAKGGVVFAIADKHNIPIRYLGVGEGIDDLRPFNSDDFIEAIFSH
jgi:fused signal recognition particle receptor